MYGQTEYEGKTYYLMEEAYPTMDMDYVFEAPVTDGNETFVAYWSYVDGFEVEPGMTDFSDACDWEHADLVR